MKIVQIALWHVAIPLPAPFRPAWIPGLPQTENRLTLVRLRTASGLEGWSAGPAMARERQGLGDLLGPYLIDERADDLASIRQRLREMTYLGWHAGWLEAACWDIIGKARQMPVYQLLGGQPGRVRLYASTGEVRTGKARVAELEARLLEGFTSAKLRVHAATLAEDLEQITTVRQAIGPEITLGIDANQGWRVAVVGDAPTWDLERARTFCNHAQELGYAWVEEPLANDDYDGMAALRRSTGMAIAGMELNHQGLPECRVMLEKGCLDVYQPDATFSGGLAETWSMIRAIAAAGARYTPHTWTNGIGFAINAQLFAASPWRADSLLEYPISPPGWVPHARDGLLTTPWLHDRGELELPSAPGLGFTIDRAQLWRYGHCFYRAGKIRVAMSAVWDKGLRVALEVGKTRTARIQARHAMLEADLQAGRDLLAPFTQPVASPPNAVPGAGWKAAPGVA